MTTVTHDDVARLFPNIQDHAIVEILATRATVDELEAALLLLSNEDEGLIDIKRREGDQLNRLVDILNRSEIAQQADRDR